MMLTDVSVRIDEIETVVSVRCNPVVVALNPFCFHLKLYHLHIKI